MRKANCGLRFLVCLASIAFSAFFVKTHISERILQVNFAPHCDRRVPHLRVVSCGLAFLFGTKFPPQSATRHSRILRIPLLQIPTTASSFTLCKLRSPLSCTPRTRSLLCVFTFQRTTLTSASLRRLRTRLLVWHKISSAICYSLLCFFGLPTTVYHQPTAGAGRPRGKTGRIGKTGRTGMPVIPVIPVIPIPPVPPAPPLFTGIFFNTCAVGAPKTRTSHRRRVSDRLGGRGWRELQRREKTKTANALPAKHSF